MKDIQSEGVFPDHSVKGYLERRSTEELEGILQYCSAPSRRWGYGDVIAEILAILQKRAQSDPL